MPKDAPPNGGAPTDDGPIGPRRRVSEMQAKLHRWAAADPGRRFDDLFNFVHDPATLIVAFERVAGNTGSRTPGVDGLTVADVEEVIGVPGFLDDLHASLKAGTFAPLPVRERKIPKPGGSGKVRSLGIPTVADRVVQAALKLVLEPIFEADFVPVSYGFRPMRRAHDAIAEIHHFGTHGYRWVLDADIEACFDTIDHAALMDRVRRPRCWPTLPCRCSMSTCMGRGRQAGPWPRPAVARGADARICRTGVSSVMRMTSSCSCMAPAPTSRPCAKKSL